MSNGCLINQDKHLMDLKDKELSTHYSEKDKILLNMLGRMLWLLLRKGSTALKDIKLLQVLENSKVLKIFNH
jgi:hypothetical protein